MNSKLTSQTPPFCNLETTSPGLLIALKRAVHLEIEQASHGTNAALLMAEIKFNKASTEPWQRQIRMDKQRSYLTPHSRSQENQLVGCQRYQVNITVSTLHTQLYHFPAETWGWKI